MARLKALLLSLAALAALSGSALAQIAGKPIEVSGGAGWFAPDARDRVKDGPAYTVGLGWRLSQGLSLEGMGTWAPGKSDLPGLDEAPHNFSVVGLDARFNLRPAYSRSVPFLLAGLGYGLDHFENDDPAKLERGAPSLGAGVLINVLNQRTYLRLQARDIMFRPRDSDEFSNRFALTAGLQVNLGGKEVDQDLDGVRDWLDKCANTPIGATVDDAGCPMDSDADSVFDGIDKCPGTPRGATVDATGCPHDQDGDGVFDGIDKCADTPKGATVDATGCPSDSDGDGVLDGIDKCPNTMAGCTVDATGCPIDSDGDGVCDGLDKCPNTPTELKADANGCVQEIMERQTELLDTGIISLSSVQFETGKATLLPESNAVLDVMGALIREWPQLRIEVGGHTDSKGSAASNQKLSKARAQAVVDYITTRYPSIPVGQFTVKGYGESKPVAPNTTPEGMAKNRRVDFKVLNTDVLKKEIEKRGLLKKDAAPADSSKK